MTTAQCEALLERASIMEYDAGLDRKTATLAAFALYFPKTYQVMKETADAYPDGMIILYEFIEGELLKSPKTTIEEPTVSVETKKVVIHGNALESPSMPRYEGLQSLQYMTAHNIPLIGVYEAGAMIAEQKPDNFTIDPAELTSLMTGKGDKQGRARGTRIQRFYFIPKDAGLFCIDIDRKPGKPDGLQEFYKLFDRELLPEALQDIEGGSFPFYTQTPNGGYHLYFRYEGPLIKKTKLAPEIEVKHGKPGLTAPGSVKEGKPYILHGELENAPPLYGIIIDRIADLQKQKETYTEPQRSAADKPTLHHTWGNSNQNRESKTQLTLDTLATKAEAAYSGHHDRQVSFAGKVCCIQLVNRNQGRDYGDFTAATVISYVKGRPDIFGNDTDTAGTIKSVFNDNGGL